MEPGTEEAWENRVGIKRIGECSEDSLALANGLLAAGGPLFAADVARAVCAKIGLDPFAPMSEEMERAKRVEALGKECLDIFIRPENDWFKVCDVWLFAAFIISYALSQLPVEMLRVEQADRG